MNPDLLEQYVDDALRILYERLSYQITQTDRGFWVWLATTSDAVRRTEKRLNAN